MPHDPEHLAEVRGWYERAREDIDLARRAIADPPLPTGAAFHAQQGAEKAMKGFLTWHHVEFRMTHDLVEIGTACVALDPSLDPLVAEAAPLTRYASRFRYPGAPFHPTYEQAVEAIETARNVYRAFLDRLPAEISEP